MSKYTYATCRACGLPASEVGVLSHTRLCGDCATIIYVSNMSDLKHGSGPYYERWMRRGFMAYRKRLLDAMGPTA